MSKFEQIEDKLKKLKSSCDELDNKYNAYHDEQTTTSNELTRLQKEIKKLKQGLDEGKDKEELRRLNKQANEIRNYLPKANPFYLSLIVGSQLNVVLPGRKARLNYKLHYEKFKLKVNAVLLTYF